MPMTEDFDAFLDTTEFASSVIVHINTDREVTISAIYDDAFFNIDIGEFGHAGSTPQILVKDSDITANNIVKGSSITVSGVEYDVIEPQPDGTGMTVLTLEEQ